jgi:uncharacterized lipoprotein NlpE involved in copper resistance
MLKRKVAVASVLAITLVLVGCTNFVRASVDSLAAAQGFIGQAQKNHQAECSVDPSQDFPCQTINRAVDAQNAAVSALEVYCQLPVAPDPATLASVGTQACNENPSAKQVLVSALANLNQILSSYKTLSGGKP